MSRMFVEGDIQPGESPRMAAHRLMASLDTEAAKAGHHVTGPVTILEYKPDSFRVKTLRLEADVTTT
jgi:hypothetical protein